MEVTVKRILQLLVFFLVLATLGARAASWQEGVNYFKIAKPQPVVTGDKIEVRELFWYGCPHCYALEPFIENWVKNGKPKNAEYVLMPGIFQRASEFHARAFYAFQALGIVDKVHRDFYDEIHQRGKRMYTLDALIKFVAKYGIGAKEFTDAFNSFAVDANVRNAERMFTAYGATGVPTIIVDGRYRATVGSAGGHEQLLQLINYLVAKAAKERSN